MNKIKDTTFLKIAIKAAIDAGVEILKIYNQKKFDVFEKEDHSPLTEADQKANALINSYLKTTDISIISEENVVENYTERKQWSRCWVVDPLDGTKEFLKRNGEFTVNIALVANNQPILGVIYVPVTGNLYFADVAEETAYKIQTEKFSEDIFKNAKAISTKKGKSKLKVVGSRSHLSVATERYISELKEKHTTIEFVSVGSSLKFCFLAEGKATIYPRFSPTMEWDTCAGDAICRAVGLQTRNATTGELLKYNKEELINPSFIVS